MRKVHDRSLPPDREAFIASEPASGRVIVIAPTRAACETIELALTLHIETWLERTQGESIRRLAASGSGFGIVAGTGTGKTLAIRPIAETILQGQLRIGVVNREREATPETARCNVIIVTTGIARRWFEEGDILKRDTLVVDEIHQTSAELELCLALGKRTECRFIWLSATVDPSFYARYLDSAEVLQSMAFDRDKAARVKVVRANPMEFIGEKFLRHVVKERRGVGVFLPTRAGTEEVAAHAQAQSPRVNSAFYHGGEPIRVIRPYLEEGVRKPYLLAMTAAGQSALNVKGLDTVVIDDVRFSNVIERGRNVLTRTHLGANEILQMAGRVHGRVHNGTVFILSDRDIRFESLQPTEPEFQLAGDSERVAITCAGLGVRADELDLPVPLDKVAYRAALALLESRGLIDAGRLTGYGRAVEALPVDRPWAELIVHADDELLPYLAVMSSIDSLHRMTRDERDLRGAIVAGSDHLTCYNLYAEAFRKAGYIGNVYGLPRHLFREDDLDAWAERRGVLLKSIEDSAIAVASVYRAVGLPLPTQLPVADDAVLRRFCDLLARVMPMQLVVDEEDERGEEVRVSRSSVCGSHGAVAGTIRYFADRHGIARAAVEGTQIPADIVRRYAERRAPQLSFKGGRKGSQIMLEHVLEYRGFELAREREPLTVFPPEYAGNIRRALGEALAGQEVRHPAVGRNRAGISLVREVYRRSGGATRALGFDELAGWYASQLAKVNSVTEFMREQLPFTSTDWVGEAEIRDWMALPSEAVVRDVPVALEYDLEDDGGEVLAVVRLRLNERLARGLHEVELPTLDRPLRFVVDRGARGSLRASSVDELQELLAQPWSPDELSDMRGVRGSRRAQDKHGRQHGRRGRHR